MNYLKLAAAYGLGLPVSIVNQVPSFSLRLFSGGDVSLPVYTDEKMLEQNKSITRLVVVVHGLFKNAQSAYADVTKNFSCATEVANTLVVAPQLLSPCDRRKFNSPISTLLWSRDLWKLNYPSISPKKITTLSAIELLIRKCIELSKSYNSLQEITLIGFSAGAQLLQKWIYEPPALFDQYQLRLFIVSPSCYQYPSADWQPGNNQNIFFCVGDQDVKRDIFLKKSIDSREKGVNRLERARSIYCYFINKYNASRARLLILRGVGHNQSHALSAPQLVVELNKYSP